MYDVFMKVEIFLIYKYIYRYHNAILVLIK